MWLLTPNGNYEVVLFAGYHTAATSDTYTLISDPGEDLFNYIQNAVDQSDFTAHLSMTGSEKCVVLSTCAYIFQNARYVVHGYLTPAA